MVETHAVWLYLALAVITANLPWLSERFFFVFTLPSGKRAWMRLLEWLVLYFVVGGIGFGLEMKINGDIHR
ncbi:MAG: DUF2818 family protein, partial [Gammaproteobacteria bacterium]|nr:DUF2818 family protein [Gammaproteobacteria bacterium]